MIERQDKTEKIRQRHDANAKARQGSEDMTQRQDTQAKARQEQARQIDTTRDSEVFQYTVFRRV